jgi:hypothetical protein
VSSGRGSAGPRCAAELRTGRSCRRPFPSRLFPRHSGRLVPDSEDRPVGGDGTDVLERRALAQPEVVPSLLRGGCLAAAFVASAEVFRDHGGTILGGNLLQVHTPGTSTPKDRAARGRADVTDPLSLSGESDEVVVPLVGGEQDRSPARIARGAAAHLQGDRVPRGEPQRCQRHTDVVEPPVPGRRRSEVGGRCGRSSPGGPSAVPPAGELTVVLPGHRVTGVRQDAGLKALGPDRRAGGRHEGGDGPTPVCRQSTAATVSR